MLFSVFWWGYFLSTLCLETKGGAQNSSRFERCFLLDRSFPLRIGICTTLLLHGLWVDVSAACYAMTLKALYSAGISWCTITLEATRNKALEAHDFKFDAQNLAGISLV